MHDNLASHIVPSQQGAPTDPQVVSHMPAVQRSPRLQSPPAQHALPAAPQSALETRHIPVAHSRPAPHMEPSQQGSPAAPHIGSIQRPASQLRSALHESPVQHA